MATVILGGGITGLGAGYFLSKAGESITVIEKRDSIGGMAASFKHKDFTFDVGPHKLYSTIPGIMNVYKELLGDDCVVVKKKNSLRLCGRYFSFPIKPLQFIIRFPKIKAISCSFSYLLTLMNKKTDIINYEDYFLSGFGNAAYKLLFENFCWKVWGDPKKISAELAKRRIPVPNITELVKNMLVKKQKPEFSADTFYYPKKGVGEVCEKLAENILKNGSISYGCQPSKIMVENGKITKIEIKKNIGKELLKNPKNVISTLYLQDVLPLFEPSPPQHILDAAQALKYRSLIIFYIIINKPKVLDDHWIFFPEKDFIFNRVSEQKNFCKDIAPENKTVLTAEISCDAEDYFFSLPQEELASLVMGDLEKAGLISRNDAAESHVIKIEKMYPVYDLSYKKNLQVVLDWLNSISNFYTIGRQGLFAYTNTDHSIDMAQKLAEHIIKNKTRDDWNYTIKYFDSYKIVD
ncbi:MAG: FAD-dependent oxidoreductase [Candidatus Aenigmarchaeota archaeon]|nr:FAD-dependent oxidoreductase [Candidatus Aenigmarchaeota archaeon]